MPLLGLLVGWLRSHGPNSLELVSDLIRVSEREVAAGEHLSSERGRSLPVSRVGQRTGTKTLALGRGAISSGCVHSLTN